MRFPVLSLAECRPQLTMRGGVAWPVFHAHRLSLVVPEAYLVKEARQGVKRLLKAGALW